MDGIGLLIFRHRTKFGAKMLIDAQIMAQKRMRGRVPNVINHAKF